MNKTLITGTIALLLSISMLAQSPLKQRSLGLSLGWQNFKVLDKLTSPLAYGTNAIFPRVGLSYSRKTSRSDFDLEISGAIGNLNPVKYGVREYQTWFSPTDSFKYRAASEFYNLNIKTSYFRQIRSLSNDKLDYWAGGVLNESAYYADHYARMPWMMNAADLSPAIRVDYTPVSKHSFAIRVDFAAIALVTRGTYSLFAKSSSKNNIASYLSQGSRFVSVSKYRKVNLQVAYQFQATRHFAVSSSCSMKWMEINYPEKLRATDKNFDIKLLYTY